MTTKKHYGKKEEIREIIEEILDKKLGHIRSNCPTDITDRVFLEIEEDTDFLNKYSEIRNEVGALTVNALIGKIVKEAWNLNNVDRCKRPKSRLIGSYEMH